MPLIRISEIKEGWIYRELKEVKDVRDGTHSSPKYIDNGYPLVTSKNLSDSGLNLNDVSLISESDYNEINKRSKVEVGDILLGLIGTIGKPVLVETDGFAIKNVGLIKNGGQIQNKFLLQYLKTNLFNKYIQIEMAGNTQKFLGLETLRNTKVPVPSPDEQSAIGSLFRTLDDLLASYKDNLANYQSLKTTMLAKMFPKAGQTVPEIRLEGFKGEWERKSLSEVCTINSGRDYKHLKNGVIPVYGTGGYMLSVNEKLSDEDAIGIGRKGTIDKPYLLSAPFWTVDTLFYVICKVGYDLNYLFLIFQKVRWKKFDESTGVPSLSKKTIEKVVSKFPSYEEQCAIGLYFSNLDNLINSHQEKISQLEILKKKLLQDMFI